MTYNKSPEHCSLGDCCIFVENKSIMDEIIITINGVEYEAVEAENYCEECVFFEECVNQECHCGFIGKFMEGKHFIKKDNNSPQT